MVAGDEILRVERRAGQPYAIIWLQREPVNAMSRGLWQALAAAVERLEADPQARLMADGASDCALGDGKPLESCRLVGACRRL